MVERTRTLVTLLVLTGIVLLSALWGWSQLTKPFPGKVDQPACVDRTLTKGEKVFPQDVLVNVLNAGDRNGLAGSVLGQLQDAGFTKGVTHNAPTSVEVTRAQIWSKHAKSPDVLLLKSWLGRGTKVVSRSGDDLGITVVVGDAFQQVAKGKKGVRAASGATICSPPVQ